jgi:hypothetical protein
MDRIVSLYWDNIDPRVVKAQRDIFDHFGLDVDQRERTGLDHGDFLDAYMAEIGGGDVALLMDIAQPRNCRARVGHPRGRDIRPRIVDERCQFRRLLVAPRFMSSTELYPLIVETKVAPQLMPVHKRNLRRQLLLVRPVSR